MRRKFKEIKKTVKENITSTIRHNQYDKLYKHGKIINMRIKVMDIRGTMIPIHHGTKLK